jgi:hypothetical protein
MESNNCICQEYYAKLLEKFINSILSATANLMMNTNTPATDSGYTTNTGLNNLNTSNNFTSNADSSTSSTVFYSVLVIIGMMLLLLNFRREKPNSIFSKMSKN